MHAHHNRFWSRCPRLPRPFRVHRFFPPSEQCPGCGTARTFIGHGFYPRKPKTRRRSTASGSTLVLARRAIHPLGAAQFSAAFSPLPAGVIPASHRGAASKTASWQQVARAMSADGLPAPRTIRRSCRTFLPAGQPPGAPRPATLARQDSASPALDPLRSGGRAPRCARALLHAATHLLASAHNPARPEVVGYGRQDRLRFLWHWGSGRGLARLV